MTRSSRVSLQSSANPRPLISEDTRNLISRATYKGKDNTKWTTSLPTAPLPQVVDFEPNLTADTRGLNSIAEFFEYFFDDHLYDHILRCTNKRIVLPNKPITKDELKGFVGLLILFGLTNKNNIDADSIWCPTSPDYIAWATACMTRSVFRTISASITFDDIDSRVTRRVEDPKFHKFREVFDAFKKKLREGLVPGFRVCIDEQLYAYRGRCSFKQFMPSKPNKYGIKYWLIVCLISGYLFEADIYLGN